MGLSKVMFLESIRRLGVVLTITLGATAPVFTLVVSYFWFGDVPTWLQLGGFGLCVLGVGIVARCQKETQQATDAVSLS